MIPLIKLLSSSILLFWTWSHLLSRTKSQVLFISCFRPGRMSHTEAPFFTFQLQKQVNRKLWALFSVLLLILYSYFMVDLHWTNNSMSGGLGGSRPMCAYSRKSGLLKWVQKGVMGLCQHPRPYLKVLHYSLQIFGINNEILPQKLLWFCTQNYISVAWLSTTLPHAEQWTKHYRWGLGLASTLKWLFSPNW